MTWKTTEYAGWGRALRATGELARPERLSTLTTLVRSDPALAIGGRRSYGDACLNDGRRAIDMNRLDRYLSFDAKSGILTVEAGARIGDIARDFAPRGWLPAVMPGTGFATVGGCIANDVHGKNHHVHGSFGQHVTAITLVTPTGKKRITPQRNASLFKATVGGLGQTGVMHSAELTMMACKGDIVTVTERRADDWEEHVELLDNARATYAVGWIDATATGQSLGRGIVEEAETNHGLVPPRKKSKSVPFNAPGFALSAPVVRLFNAAYFRRVPERGRTVVKPITDFFFPLDRIHDWNRLYGKSGFHQFQCVVPMDRVESLREMLDRIARSGLASPLAVLKRMGPGRAGYMSFPMEGYTLAVDFPNHGRVEPLVAELERMTLDAGGRIYLAKDSLGSADAVRAMYPEHADYAAAIAKADPDGVFTSDLVRRLKLRDPA